MHVHPFFLPLYMHQKWTKDDVDSELQSYINHTSISSYCCENSTLLKTVFIESLFCISVLWKSPGVQQSSSNSLLFWLFSYRSCACVPWAGSRDLQKVGHVSVSLSDHSAASPSVRIRKVFLQRQTSSTNFPGFQKCWSAVLVCSTFITPWHAGDSLLQIELPREKCCSSVL